MSAHKGGRIFVMAQAEVFRDVHATILTHPDYSCGGMARPRL
jgi:hypothetical protein